MAPFALETTGGHGASTATVYSLFAKQLRDSGLPADILVGKLNKDLRPVDSDSNFRLLFEGKVTMFALLLLVLG